MTHDRIDCHSEDIRLLKNRIVDLEALSGLQQNTLQSCQSTISWARGDRLEVDRLGHCSGEVDLSLSRSVVVAGPTLHVGGGDGRGNGGGKGERGGGGSQVHDRYSFGRFLYDSAKHWGSFISFAGSEPFFNSGGFRSQK